MPRGWSVPPGVEPGGDDKPPRLAIPEIRDYHRINSELSMLLDQGHPQVRLEGAEGHRLLVSGLSGPWEAVVEVEGRTGPELGAGLDAPGLTVVARGPTADGVGRGLRGGTLVILGSAGDASGYGQSGGLIVIVGPAGHRAGLAQSGGTLAVLGPTGRLPADRQSGGFLFVIGGPVGAHPGRGRSGGRLVEVSNVGELDPVEALAWNEVMLVASRWKGPSNLP
jgi:glutamate synthase domain-containing protein 3